MEPKTRFTEIVADFTTLVAKVLPDDVAAKLKELRQNETGKMANAIYDCMFDNIDKAVELDRPLCQDTGVIQYFVKVGTKFPLIDELEEMLIKAVEKSTTEAPLRHNAVETFTEKNTGTNTGKRAPWIEYELMPGSDIEITVYMAGGGCSLPGRAKVFMPSAGYEGIVDFVTDVVTNLGINACPPLIVGVGIGTCVSSAAKLSKKACMRTVSSRNPDPKAAQMELDLEAALNSIGLGPQGLSGDSSVLCVNIENAARHPSTLAAGVSVGCWAHRRGVIKIDANLNYELLSHREACL